MINSEKILIVHLVKYVVFPLVIHVLYCTGIDTWISLAADIRTTCQHVQYHSLPAMDKLKRFLESYADHKTYMSPTEAMKKGIKYLQWSWPSM
jgi:hypothetical protein